MGQLRRLRQLAQAALHIYGLAEARLTFLRHFANTTYQVDLPHTGPQRVTSSLYVPGRYLLRVLLSYQWEYARGEMSWLAALSSEVGLPIPAPVPNREGESLTWVTTRQKEQHGDCHLDPEILVDGFHPGSQSKSKQGKGPCRKSDC